MTDMTEWLAETGPINRKNAVEAVFDDLRAAIAGGRIPVGARLPSEAALGAKYGISRPIVREALRSLATLGMTQTRTGSGTFVIANRAAPDYGGYSARDLAEARPHIEVPAAGWAAHRRTDAQAAHILSLCAAMEREQDPERWVALDSDFHAAIAAASGNAVFAKIVQDARGATTRQSGLVNTMAPRRAASNIEHRAIAAAILAQDEHAARAAMELHLGQVRQVVATLIS